MKELWSEYFKYLHLGIYLNIRWKDLYISGCLHEEGKSLLNLDSAFYIITNLDSMSNE